MYPDTDRKPPQPTSQAQRLAATVLIILILSSPAWAQPGEPTSTVELWRNTSLHSEVGACAFSPDGARVACSLEGKVVLLEGSSGKRLKTLGEKALGGFGGPVSGLISWAPDGTWLAVAGGLPSGFAPDNAIRIFDSHTGELLRQFDLGAPPVALAIGPQGQRVAAASFEGPDGALGNPMIRVWQRNGTQAPAQIKLAPMRSGNNFPGQLIAFDPKGHSLSAGGTALTLWDVDSGERKRVVYKGRTRVASLAWNADGSLLAATTGNHSIRVWHTRGWQPAALLRWGSAADKADADPAQPRLAFTPNGWLASAAPATGKLRLWEIAKRQLMAVQLPTQRSLSATDRRFVNNINWHGDRFVITGGTNAVIVRRLQYGNATKTAEARDWEVVNDWQTKVSEGAHPLESALPEKLPDGIHRSDLESHRNSNDQPKTTATYQSPDGPFKLSIEQANAAHIKAYSKRMGGMVAQAPSVSEARYKGHTLYAGPKPGGASGYMLMLFLDHFVIQIDGQISEADSRAVLDAINIDALEASVAGGSA